MKKIKIRKIINKLILIPLTVIFVVFINPIIFIILFILSLYGLKHFEFINTRPTTNPKFKAIYNTRLPIEANSCNVLRFEDIVTDSHKNLTYLNPDYRYFITLRLYGSNYQKILNILPTHTVYKPLPLPRTKKLSKELVAQLTPNPKLVELFSQNTIGALGIDDFLFDIKKGYYSLNPVEDEYVIGEHALTIVVIDTEKQLVHVQCIYLKYR